MTAPAAGPWGTTRPPIIQLEAGAQQPYQDRVRYAARQGQPFPLPPERSRYAARLDRKATRDAIAHAVDRVMAWT